MDIIRDEKNGGLLMIPAFAMYGINRCNIINCDQRHTTICVHEKCTFGLCEKHYKEGMEKGEMTFTLEF